LEHHHADLGDVRLHYVEAGSGPLVVLLHGFPEFWYSWRFQIPILAEAGFRVVVPDMRGYNLSDKPPKVGDYRVEFLGQDVERLKAGASWADNALIFSTRKGALMRPSTVTDDHFKPLLDRVGLPRSVRFHDLRHTAATLLLGRASQTCTGTIGAFVHRDYAG
jgi:hypothetical protein